MIVLGLTGSIGMGKTTAANMLRELGLPVCDSDALVHDLLGKGGAAVAAVEAAFPGVTQDGAVDRKALGGRVFGDDAALKRLEDILHPMVHDAQRAFLSDAAARGEAIAVLDIPLLYETGGDARCDTVAVVSAPRAVQEARVLARPGMTKERFEAILAKQMPDAEKRRRAEFVIPSEHGEAETLRHLRAMIKLLRGREGKHWPAPDSGAA